MRNSLRPPLKAVRLSPRHFHRLTASTRKPRSRQMRSCGLAKSPLWQLAHRRRSDDGSTETAGNGCELIVGYGSTGVAGSDSTIVAGYGSPRTREAGAR